MMRLLPLIATLLITTGLAQTPELRRIVTGRAADGKAIVVSDATVDVVTFDTLPGLVFAPMWGTVNDHSVPPPGTTPVSAFDSFVPDPGETRFQIFQLPSASTMEAGQADPEAPARFQEEFGAKAPDLAAAHDDPANPGMHATRTLDYIIVLTGRVALELDDGVQVELSPGNVVIQNGTRHAWHNLGETPALLAAVMVGAM